MKFIPLLLLFIGVFSYGQRSDFNTIDFKKADSVAALYSDASLKNLPVLTHNLTATLPTDVEKFRAIYTWVSTNIKNDYSSYIKTRKKRKKLIQNKEALKDWNNSFTPQVFENLLKHKKTACTGYAYLTRELASLAGINCNIINGYSKTVNLTLDKNSIPNHSWNAVELNGKWYLCDPTWSAGKILLDEGTPRFEANYYDGYFLAEPALFIKNHYPLKKEWSLLTDTPSFKDFIQGPIIYKEAFTNVIIPIAPIQMHTESIKNKEVSFVLTSFNPLKKEDIVLILNNGISSKDIQPQIIKNQNEYTLQHTFEKSGKYDVHIKIADTIITTYVVRIKRK